MYTASYSLRHQVCLPGVEPASPEFLLQLVSSELELVLRVFGMALETYIIDINDPKKNTSIQAASTTPWSGRIDAKERSRPGGPLMGALKSCAAERADSIAELASRLDITPGYLNQLRSGVRQVSTISDDFSRRVRRIKASHGRRC